MNYFMRMIVFVCLYTWLVVRLGYGQCGKQVFNPETGLLDCTGVMGSGGGVGGASALTTVGAVPFVTSSGTLGQDGSNLFWDDTNNRLGIGTGSPSYTLSVANTAASTPVSFNGAAAGSFIRFAANSVTKAYFGWSSLGGFGFVRGDGNTFNSIFLDTGPVGIGPSNTAPTGTLSALDRTGVTGATTAQIGTDGTNTSATTTQLVVRAGQAQNNTALQLWQNNAGSTLSYIAFSGGFVTSAGVVATSGGVEKVGVYGSSGLAFASALGAAWSSDDTQYGTKDLGLSRSSAGVLEVNNGSAGTQRDLLLRSPIISATSAPTLANSQCTMHLASNTQLTFTCKGSDGTSRTNTLTLI